MKRFIAFCLIGAATLAQSQDLSRSAQTLVVRSGLAEQLKSVPKQLDQELRLARGTLPNEVLAALAEAAKESFRPQALQQDIVASLAGSMAGEDMKQAIAWLDTAPGRRVTRAEELGSNSLTPQVLEAYSEVLAKAPLPRRRARLIADLVGATKGVEHAANLTEGMALGIAIGLDNVQPVQNRQGLKLLQARLRSSLPLEPLREQIAESVPKVYAWIYRDVSEADLTAYLRFNRSAPGVRYHEAMMAAFTGAMLRASLRMGPAIEKALQKKPA